MPEPNRTRLELPTAHVANYFLATARSEVHGPTVRALAFHDVFLAKDHGHDLSRDHACAVADKGYRAYESTSRSTIVIVIFLLLMRIPITYGQPAHADCNLCCLIKALK